VDDEEYVNPQAVGSIPLEAIRAILSDEAVLVQCYRVGDTLYAWLLSRRTLNFHMEEDLDRARHPWGGFRPDRPALSDRPLRTGAALSRCSAKRTVLAYPSAPEAVDPSARSPPVSSPRPARRSRQIAAYQDVA